MDLIKLRVGALIWLTSLFSPLGFAKDILVSTPVTYMISQQLVNGTDIKTIYLPPKRYGIERLENWFVSKGLEVAKSAGKEATVAVTLRAIWPQDPTYVYARQGNIRLIEIDASQAISPRAKGVATLKNEDGVVSKYAWMNSTNLIRMVSIVGEDLQKVYPRHKNQIASNQQNLALKVRDLINHQQDQIFEKAIDSVVLLSESLEDFASGNQLFVVERQFTPELEWSDADKYALKSLFEQNKTLWLVTDKRPSKLLTSIISPDRILYIDVIDRWGKKGIKNEKPLARWYL